MSIQDLVVNLWPSSDADQAAVIKKFSDCGIGNLANLKYTIETPAPAPPLLSSSARIDGYLPLVNQLIIQHSNGRFFKTETLRKMLQYIESNEQQPSSQLSEQIPQSQVLQNPQHHRIAVLGFGSLLHTFTRNPGVRLHVEGEELRVHPQTQQPININTAAFKYGGPALPVEFARVSMDGRLTLVVDSLHGVNQPSWYAFHYSNSIDVAVENVRAREGCRTDHIGRVNLLNPSDNSDTGYELEIQQWAHKNNISGVVWTALPSNFEEKLNMPFTLDNVKSYLQKITGNTANSAKEYFIKLPNTLQTPVQQMVWSLLQEQKVFCN